VTSRRCYRNIANILQRRRLRRCPSWIWGIFSQSATCGAPYPRHFKHPRSFRRPPRSRNPVVTMVCFFVSIELKPQIWTAYDCARW